MARALSRAEDLEVSAAANDSDGPRATVYTDPTIATAATATVKYGQLYTNEVGVELISGGVPYYYIGGTPLGKAWIRQIDFNLVKYDPAQNCEGPAIENSHRA